MLAVNSQIENAIIDPQNIIAITLLKIEFPVSAGGPVYLTDAASDWTGHDGITYLADGTLKSVSPIKAETSVSRDLFRIVLSDLPNLDNTFIYRTRLRIANTGVPVTLSMEFLDVSSEITSVLTGTLQIYKGQVSHVSSEVTSDNDSSITLTCSGPLTKLRNITNRLTTHNNQTSLYPNDTCFKQSALTENPASFLFGGNNGA